MDTKIITHAVYAKANGAAFTLDDLNALLKLIGSLTELTNDLIEGGLSL